MSQNLRSSLDEKIEQVLQQVEKDTGITRAEFSAKTKVRKYLHARVFAAKQLSIKVGLSEEGISDIVGVSKSMVNTYLNHTGAYIANEPYYRKGLPSVQLPLHNTNPIANPDLPLTPSQTLNAIQRRWKTPCEFPFCPAVITENPMDAYAAQLKIGEPFSRNHYFSAIVECSKLSDDHDALLVLCKSNENGIKPWLVAQVTFENGLFVHTNLGSFFDKEGAQKTFVVALGLSWPRGESIDDFT